MSRGVQEHVVLRSNKQGGFPKNLAYALDEFSTLLRLIEVKRSLYLKTRDLRRFLGISSKRTITAVGILLALFAKLGYAKRVNFTKPPKYRLDHIFKEIAGRCDMRCEQGRGCELASMCPYRRLKGLIRG